MVDFLNKYLWYVFFLVMTLICGYLYLLEENPILAHRILYLTLLLVASILLYLDIKKGWLIHRLISRIVCSFKGHDLGSPKYSFLSKEVCKKQTICKRCGSNVDEEVSHDIAGAKAYFQPDGKNCNKMGDCKNCTQPVFLGAQEHEVSTEKIYFEISEKGDQCERMSHCTNCGTAIKLGVQSHEEQRVESPCETAMKCQNCGRKQILEDRHQYEYTSMKQYRNKVFDGATDEWLYDYDTTYTCKVCGTKKTVFKSANEQARENYEKYWK